MKIFHTDDFVLPLPVEHRFPMDKYAMLRERVESDLVPPGELLVPQPATQGNLQRVHDPDYVIRVLNGWLSGDEVRRVGFPWSPQLVERSLRSVGATIDACHWALRDGVAVSLAGGTHHAYRDHGEGFCVFNDAAVAARTVQAGGSADRVLIVDCDVHQGNGTAAIFRDDPSVFTLGLYGANNFPFAKEKCDIGVPLRDGTGDDEYIGVLARSLQGALEIAQPGLAIYLAGADPYHDDRLGRLRLSKAGLLGRDMTVLRMLRRAGVPVAVTMAGGYARDIRDTVDIHFRTVQAASQVLLEGRADPSLAAS